MNLHDLVKLDSSKTDAPVPKRLQTLLNEGKLDDILAHRRLGDRYNYVSRYRSGSERNSFESNLASLEADVGSAVFDAAWDGSDSPALKSFPKIAAALTAPRATMSSIRAVADALHMVIIPHEYLRQESVGRDEYQARAAIDSFVNLTEDYLFTYVLCPVDHYSVQKHVASSEELPIVAPPSLSQAFMAITMSVPMFRAMRRDIESMRNEMRNYRERIEGVEREVANLRQRVDEMAMRLDEKIKARAAEQVVQAAAARNRESEARWYPSDPMMIGVPASKDGKSPRFDDTVLVGPCWGPDFPDIVATAVGLKAIKDQRAAIQKRLPAR